MCRDSSLPSMNSNRASRRPSKYTTCRYSVRSSTNAAPVDVSTVVKAFPSVLTWMLNSRVSDSSSSPPALACFTTKRFTGRGVPRST